VECVLLLAYFLDLPVVILAPTANPGGMVAHTQLFDADKSGFWFMDDRTSSKPWHYVSCEPLSDDGVDIVHYHTVHCHLLSPAEHPIDGPLPPLPLLDRILAARARFRTLPRLPPPPPAPPPPARPPPMLHPAPLPPIPMPPLSAPAPPPTPMPPLPAPTSPLPAPTPPLPASLRKPASLPSPASAPPPAPVPAPPAATPSPAIPAFIPASGDEQRELDKLRVTATSATHKLCVPPRAKATIDRIDINLTSPPVAVASSGQSSRKRPAAGSAAAATNASISLMSSDDEDVAVGSDDDCCCEISRPPSPVDASNVGSANEDAELSSEGIAFVGFSRAHALPHQRSNCPIKLFARRTSAKRTVAGNSERCDLCFCYVCDVEASKCPQWESSDTKRPAHCNAYFGLSRWDKLRNKRQRASAPKPTAPLISYAHGP
jgi:hypothetical protein